MSETDYERPSLATGLKRLLMLTLGLPLALIWVGWMIMFGFFISVAVLLLTQCFGWGLDEHGEPGKTLEWIYSVNCPLFLPEKKEAE